MKTKDLIKRIDELFELVEKPNKIGIIDRANNILLEEYLLELRYSGNIDDFNKYKEKLERVRR